MKILLGLLQELGGQLADSHMQLLLFLYCREYVKRDEYYEFIPLQGAPFSLQAEDDKKTLMQKNLLASEKRFAEELDFFEKVAIQDLKNQWGGKAESECAEYVRARYPHFGQMPEAVNEPAFFTIGYEGMSPEAYINLLLENHVRLLADVRRNAFSQKYGFSKAELSRHLPRVGIEYLHMPELGISSELRQNLVSDSAYETLFQEYEATTLIQQQEKLQQLRALVESKRRIAITCFEAEPYHCHRSRVAKAVKPLLSSNCIIEHLALCGHPKNTKRNERKFS